MGKLYCPPGFSEPDVLTAIEDVVRILMSKRLVSIHGYGPEDLAQESRLWCLEAISRYDGRGHREGPAMALKCFLYTHCKNRLLNLYRDVVQRNDWPCDTCHTGERGCGPDGGRCQKYQHWAAIQQRKVLVRCPDSYDACDTPDDCRGLTPARAEGDAEMAETLAIVDEAMPVNLRAAYLRMRAGERVPKTQRAQVEQIVRDALVRAGVICDPAPGGADGPEPEGESG